MTKVALVYQPMVEGARELAQDCAEVVARRGFEPALLSSWNLEGESPCPGGSFALTFGGDGTILRVARWVAGSEVRIIGVQMGRLGFLAELQPADAAQKLDAYLAGDYWVDRRAMLDSRVVSVGDDDESSWDSAGDSGDGRRTFLALNDIVVGRGAAIRTVSVGISMNGQTLHEFRCDGVIVATATGSTAYSFASGGPVLAPSSKQLVITPISPHLSTLKTFVVPEDSPVRLRVSSPEVAVLTVDGQVDQPLGAVGVVEAQVAAETTLFARQGTQVELYRRILAKLG